MGIEPVGRSVYVRISPPATSGLLRDQGMMAAFSDSNFRSMSSPPRKWTDRFAPADARIRTWTS